MPFSEKRSRAVPVTGGSIDDEWARICRAWANQYPVSRNNRPPATPMAHLNAKTWGLGKVAATGCESLLTTRRRNCKLAPFGQGFAAPSRVRRSFASRTHFQWRGL